MNRSDDLLSEDWVEGTWDPAEEDSAAVDVLREFSEQGAEEEHNIVEWVETVPEGGGDEGSHVVIETRSLSRNECSIVDVMLQPYVDLVIPVLITLVILSILPASWSKVRGLAQRQKYWCWWSV